MWWALWVSSFWPKIEVFYRPEWTNEGPHENEFWSFSNSEMNITNRLGKVDEKNGVICIVSMLLLWVMVLKLSKKHIFCNSVLTSARNLSRLKQFASYMHLKSLFTHFQKLVLFTMTYCFRGMSVWSQISFEEFLLSQNFLIANISWTVAQTCSMYLRVVFDTFTVRFTFTFSKCLFACL